MTENNNDCKCSESWKHLIAVGKDQCIWKEQQDNQASHVLLLQPFGFPAQKAIYVSSIYYLWKQKEKKNFCLETIVLILMFLKK